MCIDRSSENHVQAGPRDLKNAGLHEEQQLCAAQTTCTECSNLRFGLGVVHGPCFLQQRFAQKQHTTRSHDSVADLLLLLLVNCRYKPLISWKVGGRG